MGGGGQLPCYQKLHPSGQSTCMELAKMNSQQEGMEAPVFSAVYVLSGGGDYVLHFFSVVVICITVYLTRHRA